MYVPAHFEVTDREKLFAIVREFSFATVVTQGSNEPFATHLPILLDESNPERPRLIGHMARANAQWKHFSDTNVLVIFEGPHGYISPAWYETENAVPTWNYVAVHAYGRPTLIEDPQAMQALVDHTVDHYEAGRENPWKAELPDDFREGLLKAIVGFEIPIERIEGKFKLSQNRPAADVDGTIAGLRATQSEGDKELADWMERENA
ncbi:MAG: FMN-binding negative transcriptional regulator [Limisphaerales bacterium]